jgi:hypothetical protein
MRLLTCGRGSKWSKDGAMVDTPRALLSFPPDGKTAGAGLSASRHIAIAMPWPLTIEFEEVEISFDLPAIQMRGATRTDRGRQCEVTA